MPRNRPRKSGPPATMVPLRKRDVPKWVREITPPRGDDLVELFEAARCQPYLLTDEQAGYGVYFSALAARAHQERRERGPGITLLLLDLVPAMVLHLDRFPWIREDLFLLFQQRAYYAFKPMAVRVGKRGTDRDLVRNFVINNAMIQVEPVGRPAASGELQEGRIVPSGVTLDAATQMLIEKEQQLADEGSPLGNPGTSPKAVKTSLWRARRLLNPSERRRKKPRVKRHTKLDDLPDE